MILQVKSMYNWEAIKARKRHTAQQANADENDKPI